MNVKLQNAERMREKSRKYAIAISDLMWGYVWEEFLERVYESNWKTQWYLSSDASLGVVSYGNKTKGAQIFYFSGEQEFHLEGMQLIAQSLFEKREFSHVEFAYSIVQREESFFWKIEATYLDTVIPLSIRVLPLVAKNIQKEERTLSRFLDWRRDIKVYLYAPENALACDFYELVDKLELISDMKTYANVNDILKTCSISGRHMIEELSLLTSEHPKVRKEERMQFLSGYKNYAYMRKRWEQYEKRVGRIHEPWEEVLERILSFGEPVWNALCREEIFFGDWMPALGRYLD